MARCLFLAVIVGVSGAFAAPGLKEDKSDLKKLQGDWEIVTWDQFGQRIRTNGTWTWSFKDSKYTLDQGTNLEEGSIKLDPGKKPGVMDLDITGGNCKGKEQLGIYKFDGDALVLCLAWPGDAERPTDFKSSPETRWILITLKRVKK
jgi:uncharacterized protein (TIGR03067 family)